MLLYLIYALYHKVACKRLISIEILLFDVLALLKYCWKQVTSTNVIWNDRTFRASVLLVEDPKTLSFFWTQVQFSGQRNTLCLLRLKLAVTVLTWTSSGTENKVTGGLTPAYVWITCVSIRPRLSIGIRYINLGAKQRVDYQMASYVSCWKRSV